MSPTAAKIVHYLVIAVTLVAGFAPYLPGLKDLLPGQAYAVLAAVCAGALYMTQSPLFKPLLPVRTPASVIAGETARAIDAAVAANDNNSAVPTPAHVELVETAKALDVASQKVAAVSLVSPTIAA